MTGTALNDPPAKPAPLPGARLSLALLLTINLFNYIDRYVLAAVEPEIRKQFFGAVETSGSAKEQLMASMAKTGSLATAFLLSYMIAAPIFGWLAGRMSRWILVGISVAVWSLASGASGLAQTFTILVLTRCFVGIGEAGYGPAAPTIISDFYPVERRGAVLAW
jgi:MFS family permease